MKEYNITGNLCKATVGFIAANKRRNKFLSCRTRDETCMLQWLIVIKIYERAKGNELLATSKLINFLDGERKGIVPKLRQEKRRVVIDLDWSQFCRCKYEWKLSTIIRKCSFMITISVSYNLPLLSDFCFALINAFKVIFYPTFV